MGANNNAENNTNNNNNNTFIDNAINFVSNAFGGGGNKSNKAEGDHHPQKLQNQHEDTTENSDDGSDKEFGEIIQNVLPENADEGVVAAKDEIVEVVEAGKFTIQDTVKTNNHNEEKEEHLQHAMPKNADDAMINYDEKAFLAKEDVLDVVLAGKFTIQDIKKNTNKNSSNEKTVSFHENLTETIRDVLPKNAAEVGMHLDEAAVAAKEKVLEVVEGNDFRLQNGKNNHHDEKDHIPHTSEEKEESPASEKSLGEKIQDALPKNAADAGKHLDEAAAAAKDKVLEAVEAGKFTIENIKNGTNENKKREDDGEEQGSKSSEKNIGEKIQDALPKNAADAGRQLDEATVVAQSKIQEGIDAGKRAIHQGGANQSNKKEDDDRTIEESILQEKDDKENETSNHEKNLGEKIQDALPKDAQEAGEKLDEAAIAAQNQVKRGIEMFQHKIDEFNNANEKDTQSKNDQEGVSGDEEKKMEESM